MIAADARPRLAAKARLREDGQTGRTLLLYPERGLELNETGAAILRLCTGDKTVADMAAALASRYPGRTTGEIEEQMRGFLSALADRGLVRCEP